MKAAWTLSIHSCYGLHCSVVAAGCTQRSLCVAKIKWINASACENERKCVSTSTQVCAHACTRVRERKCVYVCRRLWWNDSAVARWMGYVLCVGRLLLSSLLTHTLKQKIQRFRYQTFSQTHTQTHTQQGEDFCTSQQQNLTTRSVNTATVNCKRALQNIG